MVPIPTLPTDNLYKFMAMSGVVMTIAPIVLLFFSHQGLLDNIQTRSNDLFKLSEDGYQTVIEMHDLISLAASSVDEANEASADAKKGKVETAKQRMKLVENQIEEKRRMDLQIIKSRAGDLMVLKWICAFVSAIGLLVSGFGFWLWWKLVQQPHDEMTRCELDLMRRKLAPNTAGIGF